MFFLNGIAIITTDIQFFRLLRIFVFIDPVFLSTIFANEIFTIYAPMFDPRGIFANMTTFDTLMKCNKRVNGSRS